MLEKYVWGMAGALALPRHIMPGTSSWQAGNGLAFGWRLGCQGCIRQQGTALLSPPHSPFLLPRPLASHTLTPQHRLTAPDVPAETAPLACTTQSQRARHSLGVALLHVQQQCPMPACATQPPSRPGHRCGTHLVGCCRMCSMPACSTASACSRGSHHHFSLSGRGTLWLVLERSAGALSWSTQLELSWSSIWAPRPIIGLACSCGSPASMPRNSATSRTAAGRSWCRSS